MQAAQERCVNVDVFFVNFTWTVAVLLRAILLSGPLKLISLSF